MKIDYQVILERQLSTDILENHNNVINAVNQKKFATVVYEMQQLVNKTLITFFEAVVVIQNDKIINKFFNGNFANNINSLRNLIYNCSNLCKEQKESLKAILDKLKTINLPANNSKHENGIIQKINLQDQVVNPYNSLLRLLNIMISPKCKAFLKLIFHGDVSSGIYAQEIPKPDYDIKSEYSDSELPDLTLYFENLDGTLISFEEKNVIFGNKNVFSKVLNLNYNIGYKVWNIDQIKNLSVEIDSLRYKDDNKTNISFKQSANNIKADIEKDNNHYIIIIKIKYVIKGNPVLKYQEIPFEAHLKLRK